MVARTLPSDFCEMYARVRVMGPSDFCEMYARVRVMGS